MCRSKLVLLFLALALFLVPLCAEELSIDSALDELQNLEDSLSRLSQQIETLQTDLLKEKMWSISLQRQLIEDRQSLTQQETSLNQAETALQKLERSLNISKIVNLIAVPSALVSITILVLILVN